MINTFNNLLNMIYMKHSLNKLFDNSTDKFCATKQKNLVAALT